MDWVGTSPFIVAALLWELVRPLHSSVLLSLAGEGRSQQPLLLPLSRLEAKLATEMPQFSDFFELCRSCSPREKKEMTGLST